jgi:hypothetical protein
MRARCELWLRSLRIERATCSTEAEIWICDKPPTLTYVDNGRRKIQLSDLRFRAGSSPPDVAHDAALVDPCTRWTRHCEHKRASHDAQGFAASECPQSAAISSRSANGPGDQVCRVVDMSSTHPKSSGGERERAATKGKWNAVRRRRARDNACTTQPEPLVGYTVNTRNRTRDKCRYVAQNAQRISAASLCCAMRTERRVRASE